MTNPYSLLDALVDKLRDIPALVALVGTKEAIQGHRDAYPGATTTEAIYALQPPAILIIWDGSGPSSAQGREVWQHSFRAIFRCSAEISGAPGGYGLLWDQFVNGVPAGGNQPFFRAAVHESCYPIDTPSISRTFLLTSPETGQGIEYFESRFSLTEKG